MTAAALEATSLGKSYRRYASFWWRVVGWCAGHATHFRDDWVLRDVTFSVAPGEAVGIVGRNGAGKSTLLKLITGTLAPTEGSVVTQGRVSAILELGMGFNQDFTARENARHSCGLQGFLRTDIDAMLPDIEEFADIGGYFDRPMRTFSSGMIMRVAFAVATVKRPDILIVDEALSVGDAAFQRKSFRRIEEYLAAGTSLIFVSHGTDAVKRSCDRAIWLASGRVMMCGPSKGVVEAYEQDLLGGRPTRQRSSSQSNASFDEALASQIEVQYGDGNAEIVDFRIVDESDERVNSIPRQTDFSVRFRARFLSPCRDVHFGMTVKTLEGICVYTINTGLSHPSIDCLAGDAVDVRFDLRNNLAPGVYYLNCGVNRATESGRELLHRRVDVAALRVCENDDTAESGIALLGGRASIERVTCSS